MNRSIAIRCPTLWGVPLLVVVAVMVGMVPSASGGQVDGGVIYLGESGHQLNSDGSELTELLANTHPDIFENYLGEPSHALHDSKRWFLTLRQVDGLNYPNGEPSVEICAVSEDGTTLIQLSNDGDLQPVDDRFDSSPGADYRKTFPHWTMVPGTQLDTRVTWIARHWENGVVDAGGIYGVDIADLTAPGAGMVTPTLLVEFTLVSGYPDVISYDWNPWGTHVVFGSLSSPDLNIVGLGTGPGKPTPILLTADGESPKWSPNPSVDKIIFFSNADDCLYVINSDGSNPTKIVRSPKAGSTWICGPLQWSPAATHILYMWHKRNHYYVHDWRTMRCPLNGKKPFYLAEELDGYHGPYLPPLGWRY